MESGNLVPYSVHLRKDIHAKLKAAAGQRKASALVRDAITFIIEGDSSYDGGYKKGLRDAIEIIEQDYSSNHVAVGGETIAEILTEQIKQLIPPTTKAKNGNKKTTSR